MILKLNQKVHTGEAELTTYEEFASLIRRPDKAIVLCGQWYLVHLLTPEYGHDSIIS